MGSGGLVGHQGRRACRAETVFRAGLARFSGWCCIGYRVDENRHSGDSRVPTRRWLPPHSPLGLGMGWLHSITAWRQCEGPRLLGLCISPHTEKNRNLQLWVFRCVSFVTTQMLSGEPRVYPGIDAPVGKVGFIVENTAMRHRRHPPAGTWQGERWFVLERPRHKRGGVPPPGITDFRFLRPIRKSGFSATLSSPLRAGGSRRLLWCRLAACWAGAPLRRGGGGARCLPSQLRVRCFLWPRSC